MTLCFVVILSNVLDPRTYRYHGQGDHQNVEDITQEMRDQMEFFDLNDMDTLERRRCWFFRGLAWRILSWIEVNFDIIESDGTKIDFIEDFVTPCFRGRVEVILKYKAKASESEIEGTPGCSYELLQRQLSACFELSLPSISDDILENQNLENIMLEGPSQLSIKNRTGESLKLSTLILSMFFKNKN